MACGACRRLFVQPAELREAARQVHSRHLRPGVEQSQSWYENTCGGYPADVDRPDVVAAWLLGGQRAVDAMVESYLDGQEEP